MKESNLINDFVESGVTAAMETLINSSNIDEIINCAIVISKAFGTSSSFSDIISSECGEEKLILSYKKNLSLLVQKTWVEKSDESLKEQIIYQLDNFCSALKQKKYSEEYKPFSQLLSDVVYLMFGINPETEDFDEYALRIDPEFGIFWWYVSTLPKTQTWSEEKCRIVLLLGMFFLANY